MKLLRQGTFPDVNTLSPTAGYHWFDTGGLCAGIANRQLLVLLLVCKLLFVPLENHHNGTLPDNKLFFSK